MEHPYKGQGPSPGPKISTYFPKGYGDLHIQSADDVSLYIPRYLIGHVSPVFKDMFDIGPAANGEEEDTVRLVEDAQTLENLFRYVDPNVDKPTMEVNELWNVVAAARKYGMDGTVKRLRDALTAPMIVKESLHSNLVMMHPLPVAVLAYTFDFHEETRLALREMTRMHIDALIKNQQKCVIPSNLFQHILSLRRGRVAWFKSKVKYIYMWTNAKADCPQCLRYRAYQVHDTMVKVDDHPVFEVFKTELFKPDQKCSCGQPAVPYNAIMSKWESEAKNVEGMLPPLPGP